MRNAHGIVRDDIWSALPEIVSHYKEMPIQRHLDTWLLIDISKYVEKVSWGLARKYPRVWLSNVAGNFVHDTFDFVYGQPGLDAGMDPQSISGGSVVRSVPLWRFSGRAIKAQAPVLELFYIVTLSFIGLGSIFILKERDPDRMGKDAVVVTLGLATLGTFVAACMFACYNNAYGIPHLGVLVICTTYAAERVVGAFDLRGRSRLERSRDTADEKVLAR